MLLLNAILWTAALGWVAHRRQALCSQVTHGFARRAPIAGASARDTFFCPAMYEGMPLRDKVLTVVWILSTTAVLRTVLIDREQWRTLPPLDQD